MHWPRCSSLKLLEFIETSDWNFITGNKVSYLLNSPFNLIEFANGLECTLKKIFAFASDAKKCMARYL